MLNIKNMKKIRIKMWNKTIIDSEIIQEMEIPGFDINFIGDDNRSMLMVAIRMNRIELVRYLLSYPNIIVNYKSRYNYTALYCCDNVSILKLLLSRRDIDVNIQTKSGETALHNGCGWGHEACVKELILDARVNTSIRDIYGRTARDLALRYGSFGIAKIIRNSEHTSLLRIPNNLLCRDIVRMIIEEYAWYNTRITRKKST